VTNPKHIFVHVGMGFHIELTIPEAIKFVEKRIEFLKLHKLDSKESKIKEIQEHISSAALLLNQLQEEIQRGVLEY
jgi:prefoldin subunit 5